MSPAYCSVFCGCCPPPPSSCPPCPYPDDDVWSPLKNSTFQEPCPNQPKGNSILGLINGDYNYFYFSLITKGNLWSVQENMDAIIGFCIDKKNPIPYYITITDPNSNTTQSYATFISFTPGVPTSSVFEVPSFCTCDNSTATPAVQRPSKRSSSRSRLSMFFGRK